MLGLSSSKEADVEGMDEDSPPRSPKYEELLEAVTRAIAKLNIEWPSEKQAEPQKSKLDECFLQSRPPPPRRSVEVLRSWARTNLGPPLHPRF